MSTGLLRHYVQMLRLNPEAPFPSQRKEKAVSLTSGRAKERMHLVYCHKTLPAWPVFVHE